MLERLSAEQLERHRKEKIDLTQVELAYHWLTEDKLFDACYSLDETHEETKYVLKKGPMPPLPSPVFRIDWNTTIGTCFTVDPAYTEPAFNEDGSCIVFDMKAIIS